MAVNFNDFYDAQTARQIAVGGRSGMNHILAEINLMQLMMDAAAGSRQTSVDILATAVLTLNGVTITGTPMTIDADAVYYNAWVDPATYTGSQYDVAREEMDTVVTYFTRIGYSIRRYRDGTNNRFFWRIKW